MNPFLAVVALLGLMTQGVWANNSDDGGPGLQSACTATDTVTVTVTYTPSPVSAIVSVEKTVRPVTSIITTIIPAPVSTETVFKTVTDVFSLERPEASNAGSSKGPYFFTTSGTHTHWIGSSPSSGVSLVMETTTVDVYPVGTSINTSVTPSFFHQTTGLTTTEFVTITSTHTETVTPTSVTGNTSALASSSRFGHYTNTSSSAAPKVTSRPSNTNLTVAPASSTFSLLSLNLTSLVPTITHSSSLISATATFSSLSLTSASAVNNTSAVSTTGQANTRSSSASTSAEAHSGTTSATGYKILPSPTLSDPVLPLTLTTNDFTALSLSTSTSTLPETVVPMMPPGWGKHPSASLSTLPQTVVPMMPSAWGKSHSAPATTPSQIIVPVMPSPWKNFSSAPVSTLSQIIVPVLPPVRKESARAIGDTVYFTIDGSVWSWVNEYSPTVAPTQAPTGSVSTEAATTSLFTSTTTAASQITYTVTTARSTTPVMAASTSAEPSVPFSQTSSPVPSSTCAGINQGPFTITFDDLPTYGEPPNDTIYPPIINPYHVLQWSEGFSYVPPPNAEPFNPKSGHQMGVFIVDGDANIHSENYTGPIPPAVDVNGMFGSGPNYADSAFWFGADSAWVGCSGNSGEMCSFSAYGWKLNVGTGLPVMDAVQVFEMPSCNQTSGCELSQITFFDGFASLTALELVATIGNSSVPQGWYVDDLALAWTNNSCSAIQARDNVFSVSQPML